MSNRINCIENLIFFSKVADIPEKKTLIHYNISEALKLSSRYLASRNQYLRSITGTILYSLYGLSEVLEYRMSIRGSTTNPLEIPMYKSKESREPIFIDTKLDFENPNLSPIKASTLHLDEDEVKKLRKLKDIYSIQSDRKIIPQIVIAMASIEFEKQKGYSYLRMEEDQ